MGAKVVTKTSNLNLKSINSKSANTISKAIRPIIVKTKSDVPSSVVSTPPSTCYDCSLRQSIINNFIIRGICVQSLLDTKC